MSDPLTEVVTLLQPSASHSKLVGGAGAWRVRRSEAGQPFYCLILQGCVRLEVDRHEALELQEGDFVLVPAAYGFTMSGPEREVPGGNDPWLVARLDGETRHGVQSGPADERLLVGYCSFGSPDAEMLVSLMPEVVLVRGEERLNTLVRLVADESAAERPGREAVLTRMLEVMLIESLRSCAGNIGSPGLLRGLADARLAVAIRCMHEAPTRAWTVADLAKQAALSRTSFFEKFSRAVGMAPMEYLLAWRMAIAKKMLRTEDAGVAEVAERVGYGSASAFNVAFTRYTGVPPGRYARQKLNA